MAGNLCIFEPAMWHFLVWKVPGFLDTCPIKKAVPCRAMFTVVQYSEDLNTDLIEPFPEQ